ncbi:Tetratricopeptide repeat containing protein [Gracilaria domingensis]|nr:Tetratricopeptide repeat containing protein [Gracilaria domingensis]
MLEDPAFKKIVEELTTDPTSLSKHIADPRVLKLFTILSQTSTGAQPGETVVEDANATAKDVPMPDVSSVPEAPDPSKMGPKERSLYEKERGTEAYKKRDFPTAIEHYSKALEFDPDNMAFYTNRAAARLESGDIDGAIEDCKTAIKENSERHLRTDFKIIARAYGRMGNAYLKQEDYEHAIEAFEKSLVEYSDPKVTRALREAERVQRKRAEEAYINPELSAKERKEGNELFLAGKFPESISKYTEAIKRNPKDAAPYSNRAAAYMKLGEFPMAMKDCERCLDIDPTFVKAYIRKGNIHFYMKEYHKCLEVYEKGLKLAPNNKDLRQGLFKTNMKIQEQQSSGEVDQAQMEQAMKDPEIQQILQDPQMNSLLKQMQEDPKFAAQAMKDPAIASKVQKLIASGILRVA